MILHTEQDHIARLDDELVTMTKDFLILGPLSWPKDAMRGCLRVMQGKGKHLPQFDYAPADYTGQITQLGSFIKKLRHEEHPALEYLRDTAESYLLAYRILQGVGTSQVTEFSKKLYGAPNDVLTGYKRSHVDVARYFLRVVEEYRFAIEEEPLIYSASEFRDHLQKLINKAMPKQPGAITVTVDNDISARASAGSSYVKIRKGARFSQMDLQQLFHHEVMIHTATYLNGRAQPVLKSLGYAAPRTTATQEGLAMFAEYITSSINLVRLRRVALRIIALDMAEKGADFGDLFRFFRRHGQNEEESYYSTMRIFRGGSPKGSIIFYKDNVYLRGLIEVSVFLKQAMHQGMLHDIDLLFCGKLTIQDVHRLYPLLEDGTISVPQNLPHWAQNSSELAAHLAFNDLTERFRIEDE